MLSDCNTVNLGTEQNRIEQNRIEQNRIDTEQNRTVQYSTEQKRGEQYSTVQYSTVQYSTVQNRTERNGPGSDSSVPFPLFDLTQNIKTEKQSQIRNPKKEMK